MKDCYKCRLNPDTTMTKGTFKIDVINKLLKIGDDVFTLTQTEMNILGIMSDGKFITPLILTKRLVNLGPDFKTTSATIRTYLKDIRKKLGPLNIETQGNLSKTRTRLLNGLG